MQLVVNDLSAKFPCPDREMGRGVMESFINTYFVVKKMIGNDSVLLDKDYRSFELARDYRIEQWQNDPKIDVELKRRFRRLLNQSCTFDSEQFEENFEWKLEAAFYHGELSSRSCQLAYEIEGVLISFLSETFWKSETVKGNYVYLDETGAMISEEADLPNVSCKDNMDSFCRKWAKILTLQKRKAVRSGLDIAVIREEEFPNLIFCENAIRQLSNEIGGTEAGQVFRRLLELQRTAASMDGKFDRGMLSHATPESSATLQRYEAEHKIRLPDGRLQIFSWHVRFTGGYGGRIFFEPMPEKSRIYIGHIGKKLPTVKFH